MTGKERRSQIIEILKSSTAPVSGTHLAKQLGVSRQVIVQDLALLRTSGENILSTNKGYIYSQTDLAKTRIYKVSHTDEQIQDELNTIVDLGGEVLDVFVSHRVYGTIQAELNIRSRRDVNLFVENIKSGKSTPLKNVTSNYHYHTIRAESEDVLELIYAELEKKGYLVKLDDWDWEKIYGNKLV